MTKTILISLSAYIGVIETNIIKKGGIG